MFVAEVRWDSAAAVDCRLSAKRWALWGANFSEILSLGRTRVPRSGGAIDRGVGHLEAMGEDDFILK